MRHALHTLAYMTLVLALTVCVFNIADAQQQQAQDKFVPLSDANFNRVFGAPPAADDKNAFATFFNNAFRIILSLGAILAVLRIAYAGYLRMGSDVWTNKQKSSKILGDVVIGILLLLSIYLILYQINPDILKLDVFRGLK